MANIEQDVQPGNPRYSLHLDQAAITGWALFKEGNPVEVGAWTIRPDGANKEVKLAYQLLFHVTHLVRVYNPIAVTIEDVHSTRHAKTAIGLGKLHGALLMGLYILTEGYDPWAPDVASLLVQDVSKVRQRFGLGTNEAFLAAAKKFPQLDSYWTGTKKDYDVATAVAHGLYFWDTLDKRS